MSEPTEWGFEDEVSWHRPFGAFRLFAWEDDGVSKWSVNPCCSRYGCDRYCDLDKGESVDLPTARRDAERAARGLLLDALAELGPEEPERAEMAVYVVLDEDVDHGEV